MYIVIFYSTDKCSKHKGFFFTFKLSHITFSCLQQKQCSSVVLSFVPGSDPGSSVKSTDGSLSDYDSSDDLSSEGEQEEDDLYQPLSFRLVNVPLMKTDTSCT